jgi:hypothetical protein
MPSIEELQNFSASSITIKNVLKGNYSKASSASINNLGYVRIKAKLVVLLSTIVLYGLARS